MASATLRWNWWTLVPLTFVAAIVAAPYFMTHSFLAIGLALERGLAIVCHQRPERSFPRINAGAPTEKYIHRSCRGFQLQCT